MEIAESNSILCKIIAEQIAKRSEQRITFAEFMDLALYHPQQGYYATNQSGEGIQSDFLTSSHLGSDFGELLAQQFVQMWEILERPNPFTLIEMGAGQGLLVQDILRYLHKYHFACFEALQYIIIEKSPALAAEQQRRFGKFAESWGSLTWQTWEEIPNDSIVGCCFSNELVDAFPVHRVVRVGKTLQEIYLGTSFQETIGELSTPKLTEYFERVNVNLTAQSYPEGYRSEVNLQALDWLESVSDRLHQGYLLTIDYGYSAQRYYSPTRTQGTLQCYYQHAHHDDPYLAIGRQDITAHVNFTALERWGEQFGLQNMERTQQGLFLMALGLGDRLAALSSSDQSLQDILRRRESLHALMNPMGLGNFGVLIQSKGLKATQQNQPLTGLSAPML
ncbi:MAG: SAM-dependent methyltransferase [Timaviella obliquedivisa GSE-PSE-MK23-08B]|jgi:SAM-dependent MidA family methyltransferase|nr:SAM-dependent methyltransferase [Timaviella obliquedivisa GSE-PSE-MK23-08B]